MEFRAQPAYQPWRAAVPWWHITGIEAAYRSGRVAPAVHPDVHGLFVDLLPLNHPNITQLLTDPAHARAMPADHPAVDVWIAQNATPLVTPYRCVRACQRACVRACVRGVRGAGC